MLYVIKKQRWGISKFVESDIKKKHNLEKFGMVPQHSFLQEVNSCLISTVPEGFYDNAEKGSIVLKKSPTFSFCKEGVLLDDQSVATKIPIKSELVILATGFKGDQKLKDIFVSSKFQDHVIGSSDKTVPLYRECIHPRIPTSGDWIFREHCKFIHFRVEVSLGIRIT
ncbi:putative flavin-containing monooxygenase 1 [Bienertia sinuspersici]